MHRTLVCLALTMTSSLSFAGVASVTAIPAAKPAPSSSIVAKPMPAVCHTSSKYLIMERSSPMGAGVDFLIHVKKNANEKVACPLAAKNITWKIPNSAAQFYVGQVGDLLIVDSGTGSTQRNGFIWDLAKRKQVKTLTYNEMALKGSSVLYWTPSKDKVTTKNCPNLGALKKLGLTEQVIEYQDLLDLKTMKVIKTKKSRCSGIS